MDLSFLPVDLKVVILKPSVAKDQPLLSQARDSQEYLF